MEYKESYLHELRASYRQRRENLYSLGFSSYKEYLGSELWKTIRSAILTPKTKCMACPQQRRRIATQIHHLDYLERTLAGIFRKHLVPLCAKHHQEIEFASNGRKRPLYQANHRLFQIAKGHGRKWVQDYIKTLRKNAELEDRDKWEKIKNPPVQQYVFLSNSNSFSAWKIREPYPEVMATHRSIPLRH